MGNFIVCLFCPTRQLCLLERYKALILFPLTSEARLTSIPPLNAPAESNSAGFLFSNWC
jgi:hypothetical protein